jgi:hypothetical protein
VLDSLYSQAFTTGYVVAESTSGHMWFGQNDIVLRALHAMSNVPTELIDAYDAQNEDRHPTCWLLHDRLSWR